MAAHTQTLSTLVDGILRGGIRVVDLTMPLDASTQTIRLPPQFAPSKAFSLEEISRYDARGPAWYWNNISCGEHTGTHFDAPVHWVTGKDYPDNATHNIPVERFIGPACVIDVSAQVRSSADFLLTQGVVEEWERKHGRIPSRAWVLIRTDWSKHTGEAFLNVGADGSHTPGFHPECVPFLAREPSAHLQSHVSLPYDHARRQSIRSRQLDQSRSAAADRRRGDRSAAQDCERIGQPAARARARARVVCRPPLTMNAGNSEYSAVAARSTH
jgi:kynurenine formamidase